MGTRPSTEALPGVAKVRSLTHQQAMTNYDGYGDFQAQISNDDKVMMVMTNIGGNNNKFYEAVLAGDTVQVRFGRVGADGQRTTYAGGRRMFQRKLNEKWNKGYRPVAVATSARESANTSLRDAASKGLVAGAASDPKVSSLIDYLVAKNAHDIGQASGGKIRVLNGQVQTPLGLLTQPTITKARSVLSDLQGATGLRRNELLESYLMLVPQDIGRTRGWEEVVLTKPDEFDKQSQFLDQLEASLDVALAQSKANEDTDDDAKTVDLFRFKLVPLEDAAELARIEQKYQSTANSRHGYGVTHAKVRAVYVLTDSKRTVPFDDVAKKVGNVQELWHGSRAHNILSIMAKGLFIPPTHGSGIQIAGRMFGNGIYFSNQSTKSANYSRGGVWSSGADNRWFMLLADVAMGNEYRPEKDTNYGYGGARWDDVYSGRKTDGKGRRFDSVNVRPGTNGVMNHEAIVANLDQINLHYLVEFEG